MAGEGGVGVWGVGVEVLGEKMSPPPVAALTDGRGMEG